MKRNSKCPTMPPYVTHETPEQILIVYNLGGARGSNLQIQVSPDRTRMSVLAEKIHDDCADEYVWTFLLPQSIDPELISLVGRNDIYKITLPKKNFWATLVNHLVPDLHPHLAFAT